MAKQKSLKLNMVMNSILTMSSFIFPLITFPYVSRILLPVGTGKISFAASLIAYFTMFAQLGIPTYGVRACAKVRDDRKELSRIVQELLIINLVMCAICYVVLFILLATVPKFQAERTLIIVMSFTIILSAIGVEWLYGALEQYTYIAVRSIIFKIISVIAMFLLVHKQEDYIIYGGITIFAASASSVLNFINMHKFVDLKPVGNYNFKRHLKAVGIFFAVSCATTIYTNLDTVLLGFMKGDVDVGYYNAAIKVKNILLSVVTSLGAVLLPRSSYCIEHNMMDEFRRITKKALNFVILAAVPLFVYFTIYAQEVIYLLSGKAYAESILPMQIIMPILLLIGVSNILGFQVMVPLDQEKYMLYSVILGAIVDVIIDVALIPKYASAGVAFGTLVAEAVVLIYQMIVLRKDVKSYFGSIHYLRIIFATLLASLACVWVKMLGLNVFFSLVISATLFFGVYGIYMMIRREELVWEAWGVVVKKIKRNK